MMPFGSNSRFYTETILQIIATMEEKIPKSSRLSINRAIVIELFAGTLIVFCSLSPS